jgi:hypothetical protein
VTQGMRVDPIVTGNPQNPHPPVGDEAGAE